MKIASFLASAALLAGSTAAVAAAPAAAPPAPSGQAQVPSPWLMLSAMSSTRSIALGGAAAAAQPNDAPPPPPPPYAAGPVINGEVIGILVWFALIAIALGISGESGAPNSPA
jgi:hypothetical protein